MKKFTYLFFIFFIFNCICLCGGKSKYNFEKIKVTLPDSCIIENKEFLKVLNDYLVVTKNNKKKIYRVIANSLTQNSFEFILDIELLKSEIYKNTPLGFFFYKGQLFFLYSSFSRITALDSTIYENLRIDDFLYNDMLPNGNINENFNLGFLYHFPVWKVTSKEGKIKVEKTISPFYQNISIHKIKRKTLPKLK